MSSSPSSSFAGHAGEFIDVEHDAYGVAGVARVTLNHPDAFNALSEALLDELQAALDALATSDVRVVVIAAAGRAFCAGHA